MEVQIRKEHATVRAGQYIFINCPEISYWQYRESFAMARHLDSKVSLRLLLSVVDPFTLTS